MVLGTGHDPEHTELRSHQIAAALLLPRNAGIEGTLRECEEVLAGYCNGEQE